MVKTHSSDIKLCPEFNGNSRESACKSQLEEILLNEGINKSRNLDLLMVVTLSSALQKPIEQE